MPVSRTVGGIVIGLAVLCGSFWLTLKVLDSFDQPGSKTAAAPPPARPAVPAPSAAPSPPSSPSPSFSRLDDWKKSQGDAALAVRRDAELGRDVIEVSGVGGFVTRPMPVQSGTYVAKIRVKTQTPTPNGFSFILLGEDVVPASGQIDLQAHKYSQIAQRNAAISKGWTEHEVEWRIPAAMKFMAIYVGRDSAGPSPMLYSVTEFARRP